MPRVSRKFKKAESEKPAAKIYNTAIYVRISVEDIRKKNSASIITQKDFLINFLKSQPNMQLHEVYEDVNCTGTNFNRPAFTKMLEDIYAGAINCVLVKDLSRFGRSFEEAGHFIERVFPFLQVRFISVNDNFDSLTTPLDLTIPLKNLINQVYARDISKKIKSAFAAKKQRGEFCGSFAPYGFIKQGTRLIIDETAAAVVKKIFAWRSSGMSIAKIVAKLNEEKIPSPARHLFENGITKAKKHEEAYRWHASAVKRILIAKQVNNGDEK
jgi:DNA invertase Pin-like site-specific DNA recombinase